MPQLIVLIIILYFLFETISKIAIPVLVIITGIILYRIILHVYVEHYFKSNEFQKLKDSIKDNTRKCNELNAHIEVLNKTIDSDKDELFELQKANAELKAVNKNLENSSRHYWRNTGLISFGVALIFYLLGFITP